MRDELKVTHIITCVMGLRAIYPSQFKYLCLPLRDIPEESIDNHFRNSIDFIDEALSGGGRVFVHCMRGVSRSAAIVLAWLIARKGLTVQEALDFLRSKRPIADPNEGFILQLEDFYRSLHGDKRRNSLPGIVVSPQLNAVKLMGGEKRTNSVPNLRLTGDVPKNENAAGANDNNNVSVDPIPRSDGSLTLEQEKEQAEINAVMGASAVANSSREISAKMDSASSGDEDDIEGGWIKVSDKNDDDENVMPEPSSNIRYAGVLKLLQKGKREIWKRHPAMIDSSSGWLYWWTEDPENGGEIMGAFSLTDASISTESAHQFRLTRLKQQREFKTETEEALYVWMHHLAAEIVNRSNISANSTHDDIFNRPKIGEFAAGVLQDL